LSGKIKALAFTRPIPNPGGPLTINGLDFENKTSYNVLVCHLIIKLMNREIVVR
jgi:hypothetical protein